MRGPWTLAKDGCDRATAYHMSNKIVRREGELFVTWLDSSYRNVVAAVDPAGGAVQRTVVVGQGFDNHCGAAMALTPDGVLHVVNGSHHRGFVYRCSDDPAASESWSPPEAVGCRPTYPSLVSDLKGDLHLTHRYSPMYGGRWGTAWCKKEGRAPWRHAILLAEAPAPGYTYPTNALAAAPDGTVHLIIEWLKTYRDNIEPAHSMAVSHFETADGVHWSYSDGREVKSMPIGIEDADPILFRGRANLRPGNVAVLPDGRPCVSIWDRAAGVMLLAVRAADRTWKLTDLSPAIESLCPGTYFNGLPQIAVTPSAELIVVLSRAENAEWGHVTTQLHVFRIAPDSGGILGHEPIEKTNPDEPDWLPSIEKEILGQYRSDPCLTYTTGRRGQGCINDAQCEVKLVQLA